MNDEIKYALIIAEDTGDRQKGYVISVAYDIEEASELSEMWQKELGYKTIIVDYNDDIKAIEKEQYRKELLNDGWSGEDLEKALENDWKDHGFRDKYDKRHLISIDFEKYDTDDNWVTTFILKDGKTRKVEFVNEEDCLYQLGLYMEHWGK